MGDQEERRASGVTISNREIYDALQLNTAMTRDLVSKMTTIEMRDGDHEIRIRALERRFWQMSGVIALVAWTGSGVVASLLGH
jgi:hypothetical protein